VALAWPDPPLSDGVVTLRPWRDADASAMTALLDDAEILRYTTVPLDAEERAAWQPSRAARADAERRAGRSLMLALVDSASDELLGALDMRPTRRDAAIVQLGYLLGAHARGRGAMTRAIALAARHSFDALGAVRVQAMVDPGNQASMRALERAGFQREALMRGRAVIHGERVDQVMFALLP
jgi:RimJ/RimL family protein N-acetyltransferase